MSLNQGVYIQPGSRVSLLKERAFRSPENSFDVAPLESYWVDTPQEGSIDVPQRAHVKERRRVIRCDGKRMVNKVVDKGFEEFAPSVPFYLDSGRWLYFGHGGCETTGQDYSPAITGSVTSINAPLGTIFTNANFGADESKIGDMLEVDMGGGEIRRFHVKDNDATSILTNGTLTGDLVGKTVTLKTGPFLHEITVGNRVPSFAWQVKLPHEQIPGRDITACMLGSIVTSYDLAIDLDADILQTVGMKGGKRVDTNPSHDFPACLDINEIQWDHIKEFTVTYDGDVICDGGYNIGAGGNVDMIGYGFENAIDHRVFTGDYYPKRVKDGLFEPTIKCHYFPFDDTFYKLIETPLSEYNGRIDIYLLLEYDADRYFEFTLDDCYLSKHPMGIPTKEDYEVGVDAEFMFDGNLLAEPDIKVKDGLGIIYYEDSYNA